MYDNPSLIIRTLEDLGCHKIKEIRGKRIQCALPDGDNPTSVQVLMDTDGLITTVHTRNDYDKGDIITFVGYIKGIDNYESFKYVANLHGFSTYYEHKEISKVKTFLDTFCRAKNKESVSVVEPIDETSFLQFVRNPVWELYKEGVSADTQDVFEICFDVGGQRIVYPFRDEEGRLISFKGRTVYDDYHEREVAKFYAYYNFPSGDYLYGAWQNRLGIRMADDIIVVEGEKSVLKAHSMGYENVVSVGKKRISTPQFRKLLSYGKRIVLAFDKDVCIKELEYAALEFKGVSEVYAMVDKWDMLGENDSPFDSDKKTVDFLYDNMVQLY